MLKQIGKRQMPHQPSCHLNLTYLYLINSISLPGKSSSENVVHANSNRNHTGDAEHLAKIIKGMNRVEVEKSL